VYNGTTTALLCCICAFFIVSCVLRAGCATLGSFCRYVCSCCASVAFSHPDRPVSAKPSRHFGPPTNGGLVVHVLRRGYAPPCIHFHPDIHSLCIPIYPNPFSHSTSAPPLTLSLHRFKIMDDERLSDDLAAWACFRLDRLQPGLRMLHLYDSNGVVTKGVLLVRIRKNVGGA
jgi:hypothetical protein